jgi:hypothetical protein
MKHGWFFSGLVLAFFTAFPLRSAPPVEDEVIPLIEIENIPLVDAIRQLARKAHLNIVIDPKVPVAFERTRVSIRWQDVTAKEALTALLDNYDLLMVEIPDPTPAR